MLFQIAQCELSDILKLYGLTDIVSNRKKLNKKEILFDTTELKSLPRELTTTKARVRVKQASKTTLQNKVTKSCYKNITKYKLRDLYKNKLLPIRKNINTYGIPQGSPISGVLANIYMLEVDKQIQHIVEGYNGLYMRYSDDFIIILPKDIDFEKIYTDIWEVIEQTPGLELQAEKTQLFKVENKCVVKLTQQKEEQREATIRIVEEKKITASVINFLGFTFDGHEVTICDKTISRYYNRMYKKINSILKCGGYTKNHNRISCENLYKTYSVKGANIDGKDSKAKGNFITYVRRAESIFGEKSINKKTKRHLQKIRKRLNRLDGVKDS